MKKGDLAARRLVAQQITKPTVGSPGEIVHHLLAMQAQDYAGSLWSIGLRGQSLLLQDVEDAIRQRQIVRTWPMRGTLHWLAAEDVRWMLALLTPRVIKSAAGRYRQLELDTTIFNKAGRLLEKALGGGEPMQRDRLYALLEQKGISCSQQRGPHILSHLAMEGLLCFATHEGKQPRFALLDEWLPPTPIRSLEENLADLAARYFRSHGPATLRDFSGWTGLGLREAKTAIDLAGSILTECVVEEVSHWMASDYAEISSSTAHVYLLPGFDEYLLGYKDRSHALTPEEAPRVVPGGNGMFFPTLVHRGRVLGTWKRTTSKSTSTITLSPFQPLSAAFLKAAQRPLQRYATFLGVHATLAYEA